MLRNVKNGGIKSKLQRCNQVLNQFFVTFFHKNSVTETTGTKKQTIPNKVATAYELVEHLWKTGKIPVEILWNL